MPAGDDGGHGQGIIISALCYKRDRSSNIIMTLSALTYPLLPYHSSLGRDSPRAEQCYEMTCRVMQVLANTSRHELRARTVVELGTYLKARTDNIASTGVV